MGVRKVLVIGLDVGDGPLILRWARGGELPAIAGLLNRGTWVWLDTPATSLHVSAWPSIYTGAMPGEHGVYFTFQSTPGQQGWAKFRAGQYGRPTFWNLLSRVGIRCTVFDAPYTHPEEGSRATQVFEWGTWAHYWRPMSTPPTLFRPLRQACGTYPLGLEALDVGLGFLAADELSSKLEVAARAKARATRWLMRETPWDLFVVVFGETHPGAHYCWTPAPPGPGGSEQPALRAVYQAIDRGISEIVAEAGPDTMVVLLSGDGIGANHAASHLLPEVLRRLAFLAEPSAANGSGVGSRDGASARDPLRRLRDALPKDLRKSIARRLPRSFRDRLAYRIDTATIDWSRTRAYCLPTDLEGYIRVNLRGREPQGIVSPGAEYQTVCDDLVTALRELRDPATGRPVTRDVVRTDDAFPGPRRHDLPDVIVLWDQERPLTAIASPAVGTIEGSSPDPRPGTHAPPGFGLIAGGGSPVGRVVSNGHVCDVAPWLLGRFGVPVPDYMPVRFRHHLPLGETS